MPYLLFDVAIVLILLFFLWRGASKGFVLSLCGLVAVIVALAARSIWRSHRSGGGCHGDCSSCGGFFVLLLPLPSRLFLY